MSAPWVDTVAVEREMLRGLLDWIRPRIEPGAVPPDGYCELRTAVADLAALLPGTIVRHPRGGEVRTLAARKADNSGWWIGEGGGLCDAALREDWLIVWEPPAAVKFSPIGWRA